MAYEVYLKFKDKEMSLEAFLELFSKRNNCRVDGERVIYENADTGVGFYYDYMPEEDKDASNVRSDGVYRVALGIEYCQPAFFFVEALYELYDLIENHGFVLYDPQIEKKLTKKTFNDDDLFEGWRECNQDAVREYMMSLGPEMDDVPVMPYDAIRMMWEWNYYISSLREMLDEKMQIPTIQAVVLEDEDLTAVVWKDGGPIAIPYVDIIVLATGKKGSEEYEFRAIDYEDMKSLIEKHSEKIFANSFLLNYDSTPKEISDFIANVDASLDFTLMDMCDVLEYEVAETALFANEV